MKNNHCRFRSENRGLYLNIIAGILLVWLGIGLMGLAGCSATRGNQGLKADALLDSARIEERWGIEIQSIRISAAGYMLDFRYRVIDPEKADPIFNRQTKPYLIDEASGTKLVIASTAKTGPLRPSNKPQADRTYFMLFSNRGGFVKTGNKVTIVIGGFRVKNLVVE